MQMEPMKSKIKGVFTQGNKEDSSVGRGNMNIAEEWEIRPGGMLVQKRTTADSNHNSVPVSTIKVRVKYGSSCHEIGTSSQASFGELKKMLEQHTGVHHEDQRLIYKKKERNSKAYLDIAGVKDGSKIVLIEDITSRQRRCLEMLKTAKIKKGSKSLQQITLDVDQLGEKVTSFETTTSKGGKIAEKDVDELTAMLMEKLVAFDGIFVEGDLKLQKRMQERRVQQYVETLDKLKLSYSTANSNGGKIPLQQQDNSMGKMPTPMQKPIQSKGRKIPLQQQDNSIGTMPITMQKQSIQRNGGEIPLQKHQNSTGKMPIPMQKQSLQSKQQNATMQMPTQQKRPILTHSESLVVTTTWETFD
ncbi:BAG FAMILY MOLECULAR CHAPERONE REGULATOR-LIKE PROTEIN [Salix purpurea]|uniref:BAG FAMILY MOLECULAR CHAPERONE REGULATOR-LIKE PROTEIN n=1 Tax=Salix purpurea TaxID=77065 RepID=A0A9Q0YWE1_SALPP|nr:BAG FAMILY MOLECULAR CHAPERONE REGULATOR-LIKE PROTEIN [Salix purpurea]